MSGIQKERIRIRSFWMRLFKIIVYLLIILALQTVVFARLNFFGVTPDLILVSVIIFSVFSNSRNAILFAAASGFLQDILATGLYLNTLVKVLAATVVSIFRESFLGNEHSLAAGMVILLTPATLLFEALVYYYFLGLELNAMFLFMNIFVGTVYNLLLLAILFPIVKVLSVEKQ